MGCNQSKKEDIKSSQAREHSGFPHLSPHEVPSLGGRNKKDKSQDKNTNKNVKNSKKDKMEEEEDDEDIPYTERREHQEMLLKKIVEQAAHDLIDIGDSSLPSDGGSSHQGSHSHSSIHQTELIGRSLRIDALRNDPSRHKEWNELPQDLPPLPFFSIPIPSETSIVDVESSSNSIMIGSGLRIKDLLSASIIDNNQLPPSFFRRFDSIGKDLNRELDSMAVESCGDLVVAFGSFPSFDKLAIASPLNNNTPNNKSTRKKTPKAPPQPASTSLI